MATRSMHKPGWRSRRRSRLSLVERAVPRLGRVMKAKDGLKSASAKKAPAEASPSSDIATLSELEPHQMQVEARAQDAEAVTDSSTAIDTSRADEAVSARGETDAVPAEAAPPPEAASEQPAEPEETHHVEESAPAPEETDEVQPTTDVAASDRDAEANDEPATTEPSPEPVAETQTSPERPVDVDVVEPVVNQPPPPAVTEAPAVAFKTTPKVVPIDPPERRTGDDLELDWAHLIANGFTDPRDRTLPRNMASIIRALVRQALSDQSSWRDRIILVTSPYERLSKSASAINFAFGLTAVDGHRAVLVDADSTGQGAVDHLGGHDRIGITDALADDSLSMEDLVIGTDLERLTLVSSGAPDPNLVDHLASRRMLRILRHLTESPETILVIDAPPILVSQEASVLSVIAGQVVLAIDAGKTTADQIEHALQRLGDRHNVSLVLNECSGLQRNHGPLVLGQDQPVKAKRRAINIRRHLPKAATAAAGALAMGLFVQQFQAEALASRALPMQAQSPSTQIVVKPERWSEPADMPAYPCHQMCR